MTLLLWLVVVGFTHSDQANIPVFSGFAEEQAIRHMRTPFREDPLTTLLKSSL